ncbi:MAG: hypothetical protein A2234_08845 [Elusimicrobia bacterium RIFOXYA2_FULL_58_8]|nr:MAG: hypothetical protein A2285_03645 [Elusimicrobia bacterium RIFOXYA12_FULL_57_11]OGS15673.1 MAG: hypothetical protein A2234_08845 [Elusimicrobia bacterium RIFOXYA2_FULL_58_8]
MNMEAMFSERYFAKLIQRTLLCGVFLSLGLIFTGLAFTVAGSAYGPGVLRSGVLVLLLTPAARVIMLVYGYWRGGETYFALMSFVVLALLAVSILL